MAQRKSLKNYEGANLLFFLAVIVGLGLFVAVVFEYYRGADERRKNEFEGQGVLSDAAAPGSDTCIFYLGTRLSPSNRRYLGPQDIPRTDDGMVRELFSLPGVLEVIVDQRQVVIQKTPSARWERIRPAAREVLNRHLHMHQ